MRDFKPYFHWWFLLMLMFGMCAPPLPATTITGTIKQNGVLFNGYFDISLVYPGVSSSGGNHLNLPGSDPQGHTPIFNGALPAQTIDGNDVILPTGTYYQVTYYDRYNTPLARMNYVITGASFDLGSAIPTPVTTSNISFLDLLGLRNVSVQNLVVNNSIQIKTGTIVSQVGVTNAQSIEGVLNADAFATANPSTTTCGIQEALAYLPVTGGTIQLQSGLCTLYSTVSITKPVVIRGLGQGGSPAVSSVLPAPTVLANGTTASAMFKVATANTTSPLSGVTFQDVALLGNSVIGGASSGDCVWVAGNGSGLSTITNVQFQRVFIYGCYSHGIHVSDGVSGVLVRDSIIAGNLGTGIYLETPASGSLYDVDLAGTRIDGNAGDGLQIVGAQVGKVGGRGSAFLNSTGANGVEVALASTLSTWTCYQCRFDGNHNAGVVLNGGTGHVIDSSTFVSGGRQQYGVYANLPTLTDAYTTQLTIKDNNLQGNLTADLWTSATASYILIYPQSEQVGSSNVIYTIGNAATTFYIEPAIFTTPAQTFISGSLGTAVQNTTQTNVQIQGYVTVGGGAGDRTVYCRDGTTSAGANTNTIYAMVSTATNSGESVAFQCTIPPTYWYEISTGGGSLNLTSGGWFQTTLP